MTCSDASFSPHVSFSDFDLESHFDYLRLFDSPMAAGEPARELHGTNLPREFVATGSSAVAQYTSDGSVSGAGFNATFVCIDPQSVPPPPPDPCTHGIELVDSGEVRHSALDDDQH